MLNLHGITSGFSVLNKSASVLLYLIMITRSHGNFCHDFFYFIGQSYKIKKHSVQKADSYRNLFLRTEALWEERSDTL